MFSHSDIIQNTEQLVLQYFLFAHALVRCDTTSAIHKFGETPIFEILQNSIVLNHIANRFYEGNRSPDDTGNRSIIGK